jgi:hypothetical protein
MPNYPLEPTTPRATFRQQLKTCCARSAQRHVRGDFPATYDEIAGRGRAGAVRAVERASRGGDHLGTKSIESALLFRVKRSRARRGCA